MRHDSSFDHGYYSLTAAEIVTRSITISTFRRNILNVGTTSKNETNRLKWNWNVRRRRKLDWRSTISVGFFFSGERCDKENGTVLTVIKSGMSAKWRRWTRQFDRFLTEKRENRRYKNPGINKKNCLVIAKKMGVEKIVF